MEKDAQTHTRTVQLQSSANLEYYLQKAKEWQEKCNYSQAFEYFIRYLKSLSNPNEMQLNDQISLSKTVIKLCSALQETSHDEEIMNCFLQILSFFPKNNILLNALATFLFNRGEFGLAQIYFEKAIKNNYLPAEKNLMHLFWNLIPRWHFRMLNDQIRNKCYQNAIHKAIKSGYKDVFDIGAGSGLLSLIAATFDENIKVVAFEECSTLTKVAKDIFKRNGVKNVVLHQINSNELKKRPAPCNLIVTEIFDAALFGENCLPSIYHAVSTFANPGKFQIIPCSAKIYVTGFESLQITSSFRYVNSLHELGLNNMCLRVSEPEPYDSEFVGPEIKFLTETQAFLNVDFSNKSQLFDLLNKDCMSELDLRCLQEGVLHGIVVWFDLDLDKDIQISTNPTRGNVKCWEQAIFHFDHTFKIKKDELITIKPKLINNQLNFTLKNPIVCKNCIRVSPEIISFLNDTQLVEAIKKLSDTYTNCDLKILDLNIFPLFGLLMAKKGATVYHVHKDQTDLTFFKHILALNEIDPLKFICIHEETFEIMKVDLVFYEPIMTDGSWTNGALIDKSFSEAIWLPNRLILKAKLIFSTCLDFWNLVDDEMALGFKIAHHMNQFSVSSSLWRLNFVVATLRTVFLV